MHTGVSSYGVVWQVFFERYTRVLLEASPEFPIHFLKIYSMFGPCRPRARHPGYDTIAQAAGGMVMATRRPGDDLGTPLGGTADQVGGMMLAYAILAALLHRERTGE